MAGSHCRLSRLRNIARLNSWYRPSRSPRYTVSSSAHRSCRGTAARPEPPDRRVLPVPPDAPRLPCRPSYRRLARLTGLYGFVHHPLGLLADTVRDERAASLCEGRSCRCHGGRLRSGGRRRRRRRSGAGRRLARRCGRGAAERPGHDPLPPARALGHLEDLDDPGSGTGRLQGDAPVAAVHDSGVGMVRQAIWRGRLTARTSHVRLQRSHAARLRPRNRAPGAATRFDGASAITSAWHLRATRRFDVFISVPFLSGQRVSRAGPGRAAGVQ